MWYDSINYSTVELSKINYANTVPTASRDEGVSGRQHARYSRSIAQLNDTYCFEIGDGVVRRPVCTIPRETTP
jgi:hypothetical protein